MNDESKEQPVIPAPEHTHGPHGHGTGIPWLDIVVAVSAVFISVVSLVVSIEHGRTMEKMVDQNQKMVEASTLPLLILSTDNTEDPKNPLKSNIKVVLKNSGVGPAIIDRFVIRYKGAEYNNPQQLLMACCAAALPRNALTLPSFYSSVSGTILPARDSVNVIGIAPESAELMHSIQQAEREISMESCYCSVLNQCWKTQFDHKRPAPVAECKANPDDKLW